MQPSLLCCVWYLNSLNSEWQWMPLNKKMLVLMAAAFWWELLSSVLSEWGHRKSSWGVA